MANGHEQGLSDSLWTAQRPSEPLADRSSVKYPERDTRDEGRLAMRFTRITVRPEQMGGVPCVRGLRIPVATVIDMVADGMSRQEILAAYPHLKVEEIPTCCLRKR